MFYSSPHIYPCGDHAVTIELGNTLHAELNQKIISLFKYLVAHPVEHVRDIIPAYHTLTLVYDPVALRKKYPLSSPYEKICKALELALENATAIENDTRLISIPVCYHPSLAPDIESLATEKKLAVDEVVSLHTSRTYRVYMLGFLPGFAYMGSVHEKIQSARHSQPRTHVPAGSVGIAGEQTGIYPLDSPGGWQLIGRTPLQMFKAKNNDPCLLKPGDEVRFFPVTPEQYLNYPAYEYPHS